LHHGSAFANRCGPSFGDEKLSITGREIEYLVHGTGREVNAVQAFSQFLC
jgi:hypothetical protein